MRVREIGNTRGWGRRGFVRAAATGAVLAKTSKSAFGARGTSESVLRCGVIGCGAMGVELVMAARDLADWVRFPAIADIWSAHRKRGIHAVRGRGMGGGADGGSCNGYEDAEQMLDAEELDAVIIATPPFLHRHYVEMALARGLHVYCEKPMGRTLEDARAIVRAHRASGKLLQIGYQRRSNPRYIHAREQLVHGKKLFGWLTHLEAQWNRSYLSSMPRPLPRRRYWENSNWMRRHGFGDGAQGFFSLLNWVNFRGFGLGIAGDLAAHQVDLFHWFLGGTPRSVQASGGLDFHTDQFLRRRLEGDLEQDLSASKSEKRKALYRERIEDLAGVEHFRDAEAYDNISAIFEFETPRDRWGTQGGHGDKVVTRADYRFRSTTSSESFHEKFMGEFGALAISERNGAERVYREGHAEHWGVLPHTDPDPRLLLRENWAHRSSAIPREGPQLTQGLSVLPIAVNPTTFTRSFRLPPYTRLNGSYHSPHLTNFFDAVYRGRPQSELNGQPEDAYKTLVMVSKMDEAVRARRTLSFEPAEFTVN